MFVFKEIKVFIIVLSQNRLYAAPKKTYVEFLLSVCVFNRLKDNVLNFGHLLKLLFQSARKSNQFDIFVFGRIDFF